MKFRKGFMAVILVVAVIFATIPAYAADHDKNSDEMSIREKVWDALGREPDCYVVLMEDGCVEVTGDEFYSIANGTFDDAKYKQRLDHAQSSETSALHEEYYDFNTHSVSPLAGGTQVMTPHTINANTVMWYGKSYGEGYYLNDNGILTINMTFGAKPTDAYGVWKRDDEETKDSKKITTTNYDAVFYAKVAGMINPGVKNLASSSISVTSGEITYIP